MKIRILFTLLSMFFVTAVSAQEETEKLTDIEGSTDHPLFSRMPNFFIVEYDQNFDRIDIVGTGGNNISVEGMKTYIMYQFDKASGKKAPSAFQVLKNYEVAIKKIGGTLIHTNNDYLSTFSLKKNGQTTWVSVDTSGDITYLFIVEEQAMEQEITANDLYKKLSEDGTVSLYINFEIGKSIIKSESQPIIDEVAQMLLDNPALTISIEGHTDNTGTPASNKSLSLNRANAVVTALTAKGIAKNRLTSVGWGQEKPIADNATEEGRAANRRVEIVKK